MEVVWVFAWPSIFSLDGWANFLTLGTSRAPSGYSRFALMFSSCIIFLRNPHLKSIAVNCKICNYINLNLIDMKQITCFLTYPSVRLLPEAITKFVYVRFFIVQTNPTFVPNMFGPRSVKNDVQSKAISIYLHHYSWRKWHLIFNEDNTVKVLQLTLLENKMELHAV